MTSNVGSEHFRKLRNPFGFLKRVIDERVKQPISANWHKAHFHVRVADGDEVGSENVVTTLQAICAHHHWAPHVVAA